MPRRRNAYEITQAQIDWNREHRSVYQKSNDVSLCTDDCPECGPSIVATCNSCNSKFDYHDFEEKE